MKATSLAVIGAFVLLAAASAEAQEFIMNNVTDTAPSYYTAANYAGGVAPDYKTSAGYDDVVWATNAIDFAQTLTMAQWNPTSDSTVFCGTLHGDACRRLNNAIGYSNRYLTFSDLADWPGLVYHSSGNMYLKFRPGEGETATLPYANFEKKARVGVSDKNARLNVGRAYGKGWHLLNEVADATNPGTIDIQSHFFGPRAFLEMNKGDLVIAGTPTDEPAVVGDPALHLDAAAPDSAFETTADASRTFVDRWYDCRGGEGRPYAAVENVQMKPFFATDNVTGRRVVDFGTSLVDVGNPCDMFMDGVNIGYQGYSGATLGKFGFLKFDAQIENIREVFVVLREKFHTNGDAPFLGNVNGEPQYFERCVERDNPLLSVRSLLFKDTAATDGLKLGEIRLDGAGVTMDNADDLSRSFHVLSLGLGLPAKAMYIGSNGKTICKSGEAGYARGFSFGGFKLAEMIIYTNALTSVERSEVTRYLKRKWLRGEDRDLDLGELKAANNRAVEVPSGTLRVAKLKVGTDKTLVKKGAGTLEATMAPTNSFALSVQGGEVVFAASPAKDDPANPQPAANPDNWFRADDEASLTLVDSDTEGIQAVTAWRHCENGGTNTEGKVVQLKKVRGANPTRYQDPDLGGKHVVRLGDFTSNYASGQTASYLCSQYLRMDKSTWGYDDPIGKVRCGFLVVRSEHASANLLSSMNTTLYRETGNLLCGNASNVFGDYFAVDGVRIAANAPVSDNVYHLISFRLATECEIAGVGGQQGGTSNMGGVRIAERIQYKRELTDDEFRQTEAYLLKKYFGKEHPDAVCATAPVSLSSLSFSADATARVTSDRDVAVGVLSVAGTSFAKRGPAALSVASSSKDISTFAVEGGSLTATQDWLDDAALHLDASDYDSFTWRDGQVGTSIVSWQDVRRNGKKATSVTAPVVAPEDVTSGYRGHNDGMTNAQYRVSDGTDGLVAGMGYVDFMKVADKHKWADNKQILAATNDCAGMTISTIANAREVHVVYARNGNALPLGTSQLGANAWVPDSLTSVFYKDCTAAKGAVKHWDGAAAWTAGNNYPSGYGYTFHVMTIAAKDNMKIEYLGMDRNNCQRGGVKVCEVIIFAGETNTTERAERIHDYLLKKWRNLGDGAATGSEIANVALTNGGTLALENDVVLKPNAAISASVTASGVSAFTVGGTLAVGAGATLTVTVDDTMARAKGEWTVLSAGSIVNPENLSVRIVGPDRATKRTKAVWENGKLVLKMAPAGLVMIVR